MKSKTLILLSSLCGISILASGCTMCPMHKYDHHEHQYHRQNKNAPKKMQKQAPEIVETSETVVFYQTYGASDIKNVTANMFTKNSNGGESAMGTIKFKETDNGLKMKVDLEHLRPGKVYTAHVYQCFDCNTSTCCSTEPMAIELPKLKITNAGRLQQSYIIRGLTATQLSNAQLVLTRDNGYKAAWGKLN